MRGLIGWGEWGRDESAACSSRLTAGSIQRVFRAIG